MATVNMQAIPPSRTQVEIDGRVYQASLNGSRFVQQRVFSRRCMSHYRRVTSERVIEAVYAEIAKRSKP